MTERVARPPERNSNSETPEARIERAKRRIIARLSRVDLEELRGCSRAVSMLTWHEIIDLFLLRAKLRSPAKGTFADRFMSRGLKIGRILDRSLSSVQSAIKVCLQWKRTRGEAGTTTRPLPKLGKKEESANKRQAPKSSPRSPK
jgi:hypothetical protein